MDKRLKKTLLLLFLLLEAYFTRSVEFKMTNAVCESNNQSWVQINLCRLKAINRNKTVINIELTMLHPVNNVKLRAQVLKKANGYKPWVIDQTVDLCEFLRKRSNPVFKVGFNLIKGFTTVNHTCPYVGVQKVENFHPQPERLLLPFPTGEYVIYLTWMLSQTTVFKTNVYFTFQENIID